jgi:hypothetical protein
MNMVENCYLRRYCYYDCCSTCDASDRNPCYATRKDVEEELQDIHRLFAERLETFDSFDFSNFGMGFTQERELEKKTA